MHWTRRSSWWGFVLVSVFKQDKLAAWSQIIAASESKHCCFCLCSSHLKDVWKERVPDQTSTLHLLLKEQLAASGWCSAAVRAVWHMLIKSVRRVCSLQATCEARPSFKAIRGAFVFTMQMRKHLARNVADVTASLSFRGASTFAAEVHR